MSEMGSRQRMSFWGVLSIFTLGGVIYVLIEQGYFLLLYALATGALCLFLIVVAFDIGLDHTGREE